MTTASLSFDYGFAEKELTTFDHFLNYGAAPTSGLEGYFSRCMQRLPKE